MSWDVLLFNFEGNPPGFEKLPDDFKPLSMGDAQEIRDAINKIVPNVDWSDPAWGIAEGDGWSIEFNHQKDGDTDQIMLHVRGGSDPITTIVKLCKTYKWSVFDTTTGGFIDLSAPSDDGWTGFQAFRDKVTTEVEKPQDAKFSNKSYLFAGIGILIISVILVFFFRGR